MTPSEQLELRTATPSDTDGVAALHAASWRRHYRGAYSDRFLDGDVGADRLAVWTDRLRTPDPRHRTILAEDDGDLVGFVHVLLADDPQWGSLLDNLHIVHERRRRGIGSRLLIRAADTVTDEGSGAGMYLWVLEQNTDAQRFYRTHGGTRVGSREVSAPGGVSDRVVGTPTALRFAWSAPVECSFRER